jgi:hypothetical protein
VTDAEKKPIERGRYARELLAMLVGEQLKELT